ncbi:uncharacterized protein LOC143878112 [Tasmannia lanceolata]|uniref:uncharacterized protein LOC143878112 n=1 Tax=Tasmannia lanceolata TaxID=3420 RepID=UPI0040633D8E
MALRQEDGEALKAFVGRFNREALQVPNLDPSAATNALLAGARSTDFRRAVARRNPQSLADLMTGAEEYISVEETLAALDSVSKRRPEEKNPAKQRRDDRPQRKESSPSRKEKSSPRKERSPPPRERYTRLTASRAQILAAIRKEDFIRWPKQQISEEGTRDMSRYCRFHKSHGHDTNACINLKEEIEQLISRGYLGRYVKSEDNKRERRRSSRSRSKGRSPRRPAPLADRVRSPASANPPPQVNVNAPQPQPHGVINTISGGPTAGGTSSSARRTYARQVNAIHSCSKKAKLENEISFSDADLDGLIIPHDDALVVTMLVANWELKKDSGRQWELRGHPVSSCLRADDDRS